MAAAATGCLTFLPHYVWNFSPDVFATVLVLAAVLACSEGTEVPDNGLVRGQVTRIYSGLAVPDATATDPATPAPTPPPSARSNGAVTTGFDA